MADEIQRQINRFNSLIQVRSARYEKYAKKIGMSCIPAYAEPILHGSNDFEHRTMSALSELERKMMVDTLVACVKVPRVYDGHFLRHRL